MINDGVDTLFQYGAIGVFLVFLMIMFWWSIKFILTRLFGKDDGILTGIATEHKELISTLKENTNKQTELQTTILMEVSEIKPIVKDTKIGLLHVADALPDTASTKAARTKVKERTDLARDVLTRA